MHKRSFVLKNLIFLFFAIIFSVNCGYEIFAWEKHFEQKIEWKSDSNAFEYKVEVRDVAGGKISSYTTSDNFLNLNLSAGNYQYRVTVYDFLGRESNVSPWQNFEIRKASTPEIQKIEKNIQAVADESNKISLPVHVESVAQGTSVSLVNAKTNEKVQGKLIVDAATNSEVASASKAEFPKVPDGDWRIVVENPSGLSSSSDVISIKTTDVSAIREAERLAAEEAARKEQERLAAEEAARKEQEKLAAEEASRKEQERLAAEETERKEKERLAAEEAARKEQEKLAAEEAARKEQEKLAAEEAARKEQKRLAAEEAARKEKERLAAEEAARKEEEKLEEEKLLAENQNAGDEETDENESDLQKKKSKRAAGINLKLGVNVVWNLFDSDILNLKNYDHFFADELPFTMSPVPTAALSVIPNFTWRFKPGIEFLIYGGVIYYNEEADESPYFPDFDIFQKMPFEVLQANLILQFKIIPERLYLNGKIGGGAFFVSMYTSFNSSGSEHDREHHFVYPKANAGLSLEWQPYKHLVFELGTDYNIALSNKVHLSYLSPYVLMGLRF